MPSSPREAVTARLIHTLAAARKCGPPQEALVTTKACLLDTLAVAIAGANQPLADILESTIGAFLGAPQAQLWARSLRAPVHEAALFNGAVAHALDFDDMHIESAMHPSAPVFAAAIAMAEYTGATGRALLQAAALGIETEIRIGAAINPSHYQRGWHATGTLGHFGAVVAASQLLQLNEQQTTMALGIAGTQASGLKAAFGTMAKPLHAGIAARNGVMAALLARNGYTGAQDILGAAYGFGDVLSDAPQWDVAFNGWDPSQHRWLMYDILYKVHASSFCTQALIEAVLALKAEHDIQVQQIQAMQGEVSRNSMENARIVEPVTGMEAKFSLPHAMAQAVAYGRAQTADFTDERVNEPVLKTLRRVTEISRGANLGWPEAVAHIHLHNGSTVSKHVDLHTQTATAQDKWRVAQSKFLEITSGLLTAAEQQAMLQAVHELDHAPEASRLLKILSQERH